MTTLRTAIDRKIERFADRSLVNRMMVGTARGVGRRCKKGGKAAYRAMKKRSQEYKASRRFTDSYDPEADEIPFGKLSLKGSSVCGTCNRRFRTSEGLAGHFIEVHANEVAEVAAKPQPALTLVKTGAQRGKVKVRPAKNVPSGRHRKTTGKTPAKDLISRQKAHGIGRGPMADVEEVNKIIREIKGLGEVRPRKLSEIEAVLIGMEQALAALTEGTEEFRRHLIRMDFDPGVLNGLTQSATAVTGGAAGWSKTLAAMYERYGASIALARQEARQSGNRPSRDLLAG